MSGQGAFVTEEHEQEGRRAPVRAAILDRLLEQERRRVQELEDLTRGAKIIPDVRLDLSDEPATTNHTPGAGS